jgi:hypothetical protein
MVHTGGAIEPQADRTADESSAILKKGICVS